MNIVEDKCFTLKWLSKISSIPTGRRVRTNIHSQVISISFFHINNFMIHEQFKATIPNNKKVWNIYTCCCLFLCFSNIGKKNKNNSNIFRKVILSQVIIPNRVWSTVPLWWTKNTILIVWVTSFLLIEFDLNIHNSYCKEFLLNSSRSSLWCPHETRRVQSILWSNQHFIIFNAGHY